MFWNHLVKTGVAIVASTLWVGAQAASNGVTVSIVPEKQRLGADDDVVFKVTITNTSSTPQFVLKWHTPFAGVEEPLFEVTRDGAPLPYLGARYKRAAPRPGDYYRLMPGASHSARVELSALYDMSVTGDYTVRYRSASLQLFSTDLDVRGVVGVEREIGQIASDTVSLWIDGRLARGTALGEPFSVADLKRSSANGLAFSSCTSSQASTITSAIGAAQTMANSGSNYLNAGSAGSRYTKWFGTYNATRYATMRTHFTNIKDAFASKPVVVDCSCKQSYYAYVYPTQPYKIYVCNAFWSAPMTGTDSKGGTLVHEMSHFNVVGSTDDWAYGQSAAASLAISDPAKAIDNADSHEYFGENTPVLY